MKLMRLAVCAAVFALMGGIVLGEDVAALQAKLAAQEARLNDLQAKMYNSGAASCEAPEAITSLRKNATVTVGGHVNTRYYYKKSELSSTLAAGGLTDAVAGAARRTISKGNVGDMTLGDTIVEFKVDVNEYFDAYVKLNFNDTLRPYDSATTGIAQNYWFRWKNVCNTGFGVLVGRDTLKFGGIQPYGFYDSFGNGWDDATGSAFAGWGDLGDGSDGNPLASYGEGMFWAESGIVPAHTIWNNSRTIQVTPYWESQDGKIKAELSWFQTTEYTHQDYAAADVDGIVRRRNINHGFGSFSGRLTWKPIEGLTVIGSVINQHARNPHGGKWDSHRGAPVTALFTGETDSDNIATNLAFEYRPCFFNRLNVFASWTHGWNEGWVKDQDSDSINYGLGVDLIDGLTWYATGDYLRVKNDQGVIWNKATGWAAETGFVYNLPYGVEFKAAWRHDNMKFKNRAGIAHTKYKADTFVVHAGFSF